MWKETVFTKGPYEEHTDYLAKHHNPEAAGRIAAAAAQNWVTPLHCVLPWSENKTLLSVHYK